MEVGTSLVQTVSATGGKNGSDQAKKGPVPEPVKLVGGIGMEILRVSLQHTLGCTAAACTVVLFSFWH